MVSYMLTRSLCKYDVHTMFLSSVLAAAKTIMTTIPPEGSLYFQLISYLKGVISMTFTAPLHKMKIISVTKVKKPCAQAKKTKGHFLQCCYYFARWWYFRHLCWISALICRPCWGLHGRRGVPLLLMYLLVSNPTHKWLNAPLVWKKSAAFPFPFPFLSFLFFSVILTS